MHSQGHLEDAALKVLHPALPIIYVRAVSESQPDAATDCPCPVYRTASRGDAYVFTANLKAPGMDICLFFWNFKKGKWRFAQLWQHKPRQLHYSNDLSNKTIIIRQQHRDVDPTRDLCSARCGIVESWVRREVLQMRCEIAMWGFVEVFVPAFCFFRVSASADAR